jgi:hypothetical protein
MIAILLILIQFLNPATQSMIIKKYKYFMLQSMN